VTKLARIRAALAALGEVASARVAAFVERRFGAQLMPPCQAAPLPKERPPVGRKEAELTPRASEARQLALELMARHGLHDWRFAFNRRKQALGLCVFHRRTIELSSWYVERNPLAEIQDTILHEIAHALVGPGHGHDAVWKRQCLLIGARPLRCGNADMPPGRWHGRCPQCAKVYHRHRRPKRLRGWHCRDCGPLQGQLAWVEQV